MTKTCKLRRLFLIFFVSLHKISCTRQSVSKLTLHSLALSLHKTSCTRQSVSKPTLPSLALSSTHNRAPRKTSRHRSDRLGGAKMALADATHRCPHDGRQQGKQRHAQRQQTPINDKYRTKHQGRTCTTGTHGELARQETGMHTRRGIPHNGQKQHRHGHAFTDIDSARTQLLHRTVRRNGHEAKQTSLKRQHNSPVTRPAKTNDERATNAGPAQWMYRLRYTSVLFEKHFQHL